MKKRTMEEIQLNGIIMIIVFVMAAIELIFWYVYFMYLIPVADKHPTMTLVLCFVFFFALGLYFVIYAVRRMKDRPRRKAKCTIRATGRLRKSTLKGEYPILDFDNFEVELKEKIDVSKYKETGEIEVFLDPEGTEAYMVDDREGVKSDRMFLFGGLTILLLQSLIVFVIR